MSGRPRGWRRRQLVGAAAILVLLLLWPAALATGGPGMTSARPLVIHTAAGTSVQVTVGAGGAFAFTPNAISNVVPGSPVSIELINAGPVAHTFTLSSVVNYTLPYATNTNLTSNFLVDHPPLTSVPVPGGVGVVAWDNFTAPTKIGSYQFFCTITGHFNSGMEGLLGVGISVGNPVTAVGIGTPVFIISGTIVGLVILAIVLAFVVGKREGAVHEMPPERLGYPETSPPNPPGTVR